MSKISINRLLEREEMLRRQIAAKKLAAEKDIVSTSISPVTATAETLTDRVAQVDTFNDTQVLVPYLAHNSRYNSLYLTALSEDAISRFKFGDSLKQHNIKFKGYDWTHKLNVSGPLVIGDIVGIPQYLESKKVDNQRFLEELVNFGSIFKRGEIIEVSHWDIQRSRETDAVAKWATIGGSRFSVYTVLKDCGYLADDDSKDYKFRITGASRKNAPSVTLFAELVDGQRDARQKSLDSLKKLERAMQKDIDDIYRNARCELMGVSRDEFINRNTETLTVYKSDFEIKGGKPIIWDSDSVITFDKVKSRFGDSLTNVLVLYTPDFDGINFINGVRMTSQGSIIPIAINNLPQIIKNLAENHGVENIAILTNMEKAPLGSYITKLKFNANYTLL